MRSTISGSIYMILSNGEHVVSFSIRVLCGFIGLVTILIRFNSHTGRLTKIGFDFLLAVTSVGIVIVCDFRHGVTTNSLSIFTFTARSSTTSNHGETTSTTKSEVCDTTLGNGILAIALVTTTGTYYFTAKCHHCVAVTGHGVLAHHTLASTGTYAPIATINLSHAAFGRGVTNVFVPYTTGTYTTLTTMDVRHARTTSNRNPIIINLFRANITHTTIRSVHTFGSRLRVTTSQGDHTKDVSVNVVRHRFYAGNTTLSNRDINHQTTIHYSERVAALLNFVVTLLNVLFTVVPGVSSSTTMIRVRLVLEFYHRVILFIRRTRHTFNNNTLLRRNVNTYNRDQNKGTRRRTYHRHDQDHPPNRGVSFRENSSFTRVVAKKCISLL